MSSRKRSDKPYGGQITAAAPWLAQPDAASEPQAAESLIKLNEIHLPDSQPRRYFDPQALKELVESVRQHGILQPLLVRPLESGGYELVAGERRYRAATEVGLTEVPVVVRELSLEQAWQLALIENLQREDLNPIEETSGILALLSLKLGCDVDSVKSLLYKMKNADYKGEKASASYEDESSLLAAANSDVEGETAFRRNVSPNSESFGETLPDNSATMTSSSGVTGSDESVETAFRRNVSPNLSDSGNSESDNSATKSSSNVASDPSAVAQNSDVEGETAFRRNVSPNSESFGETLPDNSATMTSSSRATGSDESVETAFRRNVSQNSESAFFQVIEEVFSSLGRLNWLSFTTSRLPLLNLPSEILAAIEEGKLEYTKATALARVKDEQQRKQLLMEAIASDWSLNQIKEQIAALTPSAQPKTASTASQLPERMKAAYQKLKKTRLWENPKKQKQIDTLLTKLEALLGDS